MDTNKENIIINPQNHGYLEPEIKDTDFIYGSGQITTSDILMKDGNWFDVLPKEGELQVIRKKTETYNCTAAAITNQTETYLKKKFGIDVNYSERFVGIMAGTKPPGNDPNKVYDAIRKYGLIPEDMLPSFSDDIQSIEDYYSFKGADKDKCIEEGKKWLEKYSFWYDDVPQDLIEEAFKLSPLCMAVFAWAIDNNGIYIRMGKDNHLTCFYGKDNYYLNFDSYDPFYKNLSKDFGFTYIKRIYIEEKKITEKQIGILQNILDIIKKILMLDLEILKKKDDEAKETEISNPIADPIPPPAPEIVAVPKYQWTTRKDARHSVRVICDEEGLTKKEKDTITAVIQAESDFNTGIITRNKNGTLDYGICQFNNGKNKNGVPFWIGEGADFKDYYEVLNNPEKCVRVMIREYKKGNLKYWIAYSNGSYLKYI